jgi:hypothetical protein
MLNDWRKQAPDGSDLTVVPERISAEVFGSGSAVIDFAIRTIEIWRAITGVGTGQSASRLAVDHPWRCNEPYHSQIFPAPELAVWRTLGEHLSGRRIVGEYPLGAGVRCYILAPDAPDSQAGGALVAWNESAAEDVVSARLFLGDKPIVEVDLFGNETPVEQSAEFGAVHTLRVGRSPVFFEGADAMLAQFGASFRLEPAFLVAAAAPHEVAVVLHNPWPRPITGRVQVILSVPGRSRWTVEPRNGSEFSIEAGANRSIPFTITFPAGESAGPKQIAAVVQLNNTPALPPLHFEASAEIGVKDLDLEPDCRFFPGSDGPDVVVTASITNRGQSSRALRLDVSAPGCPLRQAPIADLAPGATIIKRLVYKDAAKSFSGRRIRMSLGDGDQAATLNKTVRVP